MPQFARPSADVATAGWSPLPAYEQIDEVSPDEADRVSSGLAPSTDTLEVSLSAVVDPGVDTGHTVRARYQKDDTDARRIDLTVGLYQTTTLIRQEVLADIANGWTTVSFTLTPLEASAITNYSALRMRFTANQV
jgi:hypothetical protein